MTKLELLLQVRDEVSKTVDKLSKKLGGLGSKLGSAIKKGALVAGAALAGLAVAVIKFGGDFNSAFNTIIKGTGASGDALKGLKDDFKAVLSSVPEDMQAVASAIADVNTLTGATGLQLQGLTKQFIDLGRVAGVDTSGLIDKASKAFNIFGLNADQSASALDVFWKISQDTGIGIDKLTKNLQVFGPILANAGFTIEESASLFGKLNKAGVDASRVMPAINAATRKMAAEGITDLKGGLSDTIEKIRDATSTTEALSLATSVFGAEGAQRMTSAIREGGLSIAGLTDGLDTAFGSIGATAKATETLGEKFKRFKNTVLVALEPLLTKLFNGLLKAADAVIPVIQEVGEHFANFLGGMKSVLRTGDFMSDFFADLPGPLKDIAFTLAKVAILIKQDLAPAFIEGARTIGAILLPVLKTVFDFVISNKPVMIAAIAAIGLAILVAFGPAVAAIAAIVGLITLVGLVKKNWDELKAKTDQIWNSLPGPVKLAAEVMERVIKVVFDNIVTRVRAAMDIVKGIIKVVTGIIRGDWDLAWSGIRQAFGGFLDGIVAMVRLPLDILTALFDTSVDEIVGSFLGLPGRLLDMVHELTTAGLTLGKSLANGVIGGLNRLLNSLSGKTLIPSLDLRPLGSTPSVSIPELGTIKRLAGGTRNFRGGLAVVGEQGPELVGLPRGSNVFSNRESQQMAGAVTNNYFITVEGSLLSEDALLEIVMDSRRRGGLGGLPA